MTVRRAARWLAPSYVAACCGALAIGAITGRGLAASGLVASIGLTWCVTGPVLLAIAIAARAVFASWRPDALAATLRDEHGAWPRLAGWVGVVWLATVLLAWAMFQAIWRLNLWTAFKPLTLSFAAPIAAVLAAVAGIALARPVADVLARGIAWLDGRWRRRFQRSLVTPWPIALTAIAALVLVGYLAVRFLVRDRLGHLPIELALVPGAAIAMLLGVHGLWPRLGARGQSALALVTSLAIAMTLGYGLFVVSARPVLALAIWAKQPIARVAVERIRALEAIRADLPRTRYRAKAIADAPHRDILLITLSGVRADATPAYGGAAEMPALRELAQRGAVFAWTFTSTTEPGHGLVDLMLGLDDLRVRGDPELDPRHVLLADRLRAGGYETVAFACCGAAAGPGARIGLARGLDRVTLATDEAALVDTARRWMLAHDAAPAAATAPPVLVWVHLDLPPLAPMTAPPGLGPEADAERRRRYGAALSGVDASIRELVGGFANRPPDRAPILLIVGDRGTSLGEHGIPDGAPDLYNGEARVPFLLIAPTVLVQQVQETVSTLDVVPTLMELAGFVPPLGQLDGQSLMPLARGQRASALANGDAYVRTATAAALVRGTWKLVDRLSSVELYDVKSDAFERTDQSQRRTKLAETLRAQLVAHASDMRKPLF